MFGSYPAGNRAGDNRTAAIARDIRGPGRDLGTPSFCCCNPGLRMRLFIIDAGRHLLFIELPLPREIALGAHGACYGRCLVRRDLRVLSSLDNAQRLSVPYCITPPFLHASNSELGRARWRESMGLPL